MMLKPWVIALVATLAFVAGAGSPANSAAPLVKTQAPGYYRWMLGDFEITVLSDGTNLLPAGALLADLMGPGLGNVLGNLKAAGYQPSQVDEVYVTHMHPDHIGGLLAGRQRAFANATLRADKAEAAYWLDATHMAGLPADAQARFRHAMEWVDPYVRAGKFVAFEDGAVLQPASQGTWVAGAHLPFPGIGHVRAESSGYAWLPANYGDRF
jgi:glyoxylase-like metal-dependent hydrolase (beta-lactamase superfamily II)